MSTPPQRILIVEDTKQIRTLLSRALEKAGFQVDLAEDGKIGVSQVFAQDYAVILMDLMMPNWDGRTAIKAIEQGKPGTKILVMTAMRDEGLKKSILDSHPSVVDWIPKPFQSLDQVVQKVAAAAGGPPRP